jgi:hypothetical protein
VTYTPNADFNGTDTFTYTNSEGNSETVTVTVVAENDAATITIVSTANEFIEDSTTVGAEVATFSTDDEDGNSVTVTLSDTTNYELVGNTVVLTQVGADLVNMGGDLPDFTLSATDGNQVTPATINVEPIDTSDVNDAATITLVSTANEFIEDSTTVGAEVATFSTDDEDGSPVTVTLSDTTNYELVGNTVVLTQVGADLVNTGGDLPNFTLSATDGTQVTPATITVEPIDTVDVNDAATIAIDATSVVAFTEDDGAAAGSFVANYTTQDLDDDTVVVTVSNTGATQY